MSILVRRGSIVEHSVRRRPIKKGKQRWDRHCHCCCTRQNSSLGYLVTFLPRSASSATSTCIIPINFRPISSLTVSTTNNSRPQLNTQDNDNNNSNDATQATLHPTTTRTKTKDYIKALSDLSKLRLSALVVSTTSLGFLAAGGPVSSSALVACTIGTALCASSAATFNQVFEIRQDSQMNRTKNRPLPQKVVTPLAATTLGITTGFGGTAALILGTDCMTTALGVGNIALYAGLYTYLKPRSEWNTWVGAVVGAIPPVMGYTAAGGDICDPPAIMLASMLYLWQFPHFFSLSWMHRGDYARGNFQMIAVNDGAMGGRTAMFIRRYTWYLSSIPIISYALNVTSSMFVLEGLVLNGYAIFVANNFYRRRSNANARKVFLTSLWYLPCLMTLFILHSKTWENDEINTSDEMMQDSRVREFLRGTMREVKKKGRDMCIHEQAVNDLSLVEAAEKLDEIAGGKNYKAGSSSGVLVSGNCPVVYGKKQVNSAADNSVHVIEAARNVTDDSKAPS